MGSVIKSLKKLYKKMGGTNTKGINTVDGMVDKIAEKYKAGGSGGGSNTLIVEIIEANLDTGEPRRMNTKFKDIYDALMAGKTVLTHRHYNQGIGGDTTSIDEYKAVYDFTIEAGTNQYSCSVGGLNGYYADATADTLEEAMDKYPIKE